MLERGILYDGSMYSAQGLIIYFVNQVKTPVLGRAGVFNVAKEYIR